MLNDENQREAAESVRLVFPNAAGRGTHINISGIALTKSAPNRDNAIRLMEFLSEPKAQQIYAEANTEYPANPDVKPPAWWPNGVRLTRTTCLSRKSRRTAAQR